VVVEAIIRREDEKGERKGEEREGKEKEGEQGHSSFLIPYHIINVLHIRMPW
jgi:hypothetical protein